MGHKKQPVYIHELNEYSMTYYIIFWYFNVVLLVRLMEHEDLATEKSEYVSSCIQGMMLPVVVCCFYFWYTNA